MLEAGSSKIRVAAPAAAAATSVREEAETIKSVRLRINGTFPGRPAPWDGRTLPRVREASGQVDHSLSNWNLECALSSAG